MFFRRLLIAVSVFIVVATVPLWGQFILHQILPTNMNAADSPSDNECLTYNLAGTNFEWEACAAGGEVNDLEGQDPSTIADTEIYIGDGPGSGTFKALTGDVFLANTGATTIQADSVALATDTTGNFVATIADAGNSNITVANSGSENAAVTLDVIDVTCTDCLNATEIEDIYVLTAGDTMSGALTVTDDLTVDTNTLFVDASENEVYINAIAQYGREGNDFEVNVSNAEGAMSLSQWSTTAATESHIDFLKSRSNTIGTHAAVTTDESLGIISWRGSDGSAFDGAAYIQGMVDGTPNSDTSDMPGKIVFATTPDEEATPVVALTIASDQSATFTEDLVQSTTNGALWTRGSISEEITLNTGGTTTDSSGTLLPANSIIEAVVARVTTTITTAANWDIGDATDGQRFLTDSTNLTATNTEVALEHVDQTGTAGPVQSAGAALRITTDVNPGAGAIRVTVFYRQFTPPTS